MLRGGEIAAVTAIEREMPPHKERGRETPPPPPMQQSTILKKGERETPPRQERGREMPPPLPPAPLIQQSTIKKERDCLFHGFRRHHPALPLLSLPSMGETERERWNEKGILPPLQGERDADAAEMPPLPPSQGERERETPLRNNQLKWERQRERDG